MRNWAFLVRHVLRLSWLADRRTTMVLGAWFAVQTGLVAAIGLSLRWLVDTAAAGNAVGVLAAIALGAGAHALNMAGNRIRQNMMFYLSARINAALSAEIVELTAGIPTVVHLEHPEYLNRLNRLRGGTWVLSTTVWSLLGGVAAALSLAASVILLVTVNPVLCLLAVFAVPTMLGSRRATWIIRRARDAGAELTRHEQRLHELCTQPEPAKEILIAGATDEINRRADGLWAANIAQERRARLLAAWWEYAGWTCYLLGVAGALFVVGGGVQRGTATLGDAVLVISLATQLQNQITLALAQYGVVAETGRINDHYAWLRGYADAQRRPGDPAPRALAGGIALHGVRLRYPGSATEALRGVDLFLRTGSTVALVGTNGAGKSTLVKLLTGILEPTEGVITVDGRPLGTIDRHAWQASLSGVFQDFARFQFRAREVVGVGDLPRLHDRRAVAAAVDRAGAQVALGRLSAGLDTQLGTVFSGVEPSLGQWQKLALARAMMRPEPLLVVLDEPTAALDPVAEDELFGLFVQQVRATAGRGAIALLVSHRLATVRMADLIVVVEGGRIVECGSHAELMAAGGDYAATYRLQERAYVGG